MISEELPAAPSAHTFSGKKSIQRNFDEEIAFLPKKLIFCRIPDIFFSSFPYRIL